MNIAQGEKRLDAAGAASNYAQGAGGSDGSSGSMSYSEATGNIVYASLESREDPSFFRQFLRASVASRDMPDITFSASIFIEYSSVLCFM
jgi:hypothetical protein